MPSWRDSASQQCQEDLDSLLNVMLPFAQQMLVKSGEFFPFGAALGQHGDSKLIAADPGLGERPPSAEVLASLVGGVRQSRSAYRAAALGLDVRLEDSDAVRIELEHQEGVAIAVLQPYKKKRLGRGIDFGDLRASSAARRIWA